MFKDRQNKIFIGIPKGIPEGSTRSEEMDSPQLSTNIIYHPTNPFEGIEKSMIVETMYSIEDKVFSTDVQPAKTKFHDRHTRYTTYIENNLLIILKMLQETNQIEHISTVINESIKEYLMLHF